MSSPSAGSSEQSRLADNDSCVSDYNNDDRIVTCLVEEDAKRLLEGATMLFYQLPEDHMYNTELLVLTRL
jgi:hypothetical protein